MHILVVGGNEEQRAGVTNVLEQGHCTVSVAESGEDAISLIEINEYSLIIIDLLLPDHTGFDLCRRIRALGVDAPIIILTARKDVRTRVSALDSGADDFVLKPVHHNELMARIRALMRREKIFRGDIVSVGDVQLDASTYVVHRSGKEIPLTSKEYRLLNYMMKRPNYLCTKTMLEEHVWGHYHLRSSNVIEVTMSRLRKKLNIPGLREFIVTRRGIGYMIEDK